MFVFFFVCLRHSIVSDFCICISQLSTCWSWTSMSIETNRLILLCRLPWSQFLTMISSCCLITIDEMEKLNKERLHLFFSLRSSSSSEWVHFLFDATSTHIHMNSICYAPDVSNDKSKNEQIKSMLRVIARIALNNSQKYFFCPIFLFWKHVVKTDISLISFHSKWWCLTVFDRNFFLLHHINNNLSLFFHPIVNCTHTYQVAWIFIKSMIYHLGLVFAFYQSSSALYRNNIDNEMLVIIMCINKCINVYYFSYP